MQALGVLRAALSHAEPAALLLPHLGRLQQALAAALQERYYKAGIFLSFFSKPKLDYCSSDSLAVVQQLSVAGSGRQRLPEFLSDP